MSSRKKSRKMSKKNPFSENRGKAREGPRIFGGKSPFLMPERVRRTLTYYDDIQMNNVGQYFANIQYRPTSIFDVDPVVGGRKCYGYDAMSTFYEKYRVVSSHIVVKAGNLETTPISVFVCPTQVNPGVNTSSWRQYAADPCSKLQMLGGYTGNSVSTISNSMTTVQLAGVDGKALDDYSSDFGTNPVLEWFWFIGLTKSTPNVLVYGASLSIEIHIVCDFFSRKVLADPSYDHIPTVVTPVPYPSPPTVYVATDPEVPSAPIPVTLVAPLYRESCNTNI